MAAVLEKILEAISGRRTADKVNAVTKCSLKFSDLRKVGSLFVLPGGSEPLKEFFNKSEFSQGS
jgi:hypothetical protein